MGRGSRSHGASDSKLGFAFGTLQHYCSHINLFLTSSRAFDLLFFQMCSTVHLCVWCLRDKLWSPNRMFSKAKKQQWWWIRRQLYMGRRTQHRGLHCKEALIFRDSHHLSTPWWVRWTSKAVFLSRECTPGLASWDLGRIPPSNLECSFSRGCRASR